MRKLIALTAASFLCAHAQSLPTDVFDQAPPQVDAALRARVSKFFQCHVDGKFRQAEEVIHEGSRDEFYNSEKQRLIGFEIVSINYSENYTKATLITNLELDWVTARMGKIRVKPPMKTTWMLQSGEWWWYVVPRKEWETPFGIMHPGAEPTANSVGGTGWSMPDAKSILSKVVVNKTDIQLSSADKSSDRAEIVNKMPGDLVLEVERYILPGLTVKLDKQVLHSGETAHLEFEYAPTDRSVKSTTTIRLNASPIAQVYEFNLTFAVPEEYRKYLPAAKR